MNTGCEYTVVIIFFCKEQLLFFVYDKTPKLFNYLEMLGDTTATKLHLIMDVLQMFMIIYFLPINLMISSKPSKPQTSILLFSINFSPRYSITCK